MAPYLFVLDNVQPLLVRLIAGVGNALRSLPEDFPNVYITHAYDGAHKEGSLHKKYAALDIRTKNLTAGEIQLLLIRIRSRFPNPRFDVIFEDEGGANQHIHLEDNAANRAVTT